MVGSYNEVVGQLSVITRRWYDLQEYDEREVPVIDKRRIGFNPGCAPGCTTIHGRRYAWNWKCPCLFSRPDEYGIHTRELRHVAPAGGFRQVTNAEWDGLTEQERDRVDENEGWVPKDESQYAIHVRSKLLYDISRLVDDVNQEYKYHKKTELNEAYSLIRGGSNGQLVVASSVEDTFDVVVKLQNERDHLFIRKFSKSFKNAFEKRIGELVEIENNYKFDYRITTW